MFLQSRRRLKKLLLGKNSRDFVTHMELPTVSRLGSRLRSSIALTVLLIAGYTGNYFNLPLFFGVDFLFGSIAVLLVVCLYGTSWGAIAAAIASSYTILLWRHPYAAIIFILEALFVGWGRRRKYPNVLLLDGFYWLFIGMPLVWLFYAGVMGVPVEAVLLVMLKQAVNGIFNALVASLLLTHLPIENWVKRSGVAQTLSLQQTLFNLLVACVLLPALTLLVLNSRSAMSNMEKTIQADLQQVSTDIVAELRLWNQQSFKALSQLGGIAARSEMTPSLGLQQSLELMQRSFPRFLQLFVTDATGKAIASYPPISGTVAGSIDLKALSRTQQTAISDVSLNGDKVSFPILIQTAPVNRNNRFLGSVAGEIDLSLVDQLLESFIYPGEMEIAILDGQNRTIASTRSDLSIPTLYNQHQGGEIRRLNGNVYQWLPQGKMPSMIRWKNSFYVQTTPVGDNLPLTVLVEVPNKPHFSYLQNLYTNSLTVMLLIMVLALILANPISRWLAKPILQLAEVTTDVPDQLLDQQAIAWPNSRITEMNVLVSNFQFMAALIEQKFQEIKSANEHLEQRVQERTQELLTTNRELEAEVAERRRVAEALQKSEAVLRAQAQELETALYELQNTQAQLIQTEKMSSLGLLVTSVAHEINNPVSSIHGNLFHAKNYTQDLLELVQLYQQEYPNATPAIQEKIQAIDLEFLRDDMPAILGAMQVGSERIHEIVQLLRNFSRTDDKGMKAVDLHEGIDSTLLILKSRLKASPDHPKIEVIKDYGQLPLVECYPGQLNQVFMNILVNAIDSLEDLYVKRLKVKGSEDKLKVGRLKVEGSEDELNVAKLKVEGSTPTNLQSANLQPATPWIRIRTEVIEGNWVAIHIADNGLGMTQEQSCKLFDPFFTTKPIGKGTGLGLSISYKIIVERHAGKLCCISEQNQGAEFIIKIPQRQQNCQTAT